MWRTTVAGGDGASGGGGDGVGAGVLVAVATVVAVAAVAAVAAAGRLSVNDPHPVREGVLCSMHQPVAGTGN